MRKNFKNVIIGIFCILMIFPFFVPTYLELKFSWLSNLTKILVLLNYFVVIFSYLKERKFSNLKFFVYYFLFLGFTFLTTIINNGSISIYFNIVIKYFMLALFYNLFITKYRITFLKANCYYFATLLFINLIYIVAYPNGLFINEYNAWANWFLGYKNGFILYIIPAILTSYIIDILKKDRISFRTIVIIFISVITSILVDSSTALVGIIILLVGLFFQKSFSKLKIINYNTLLYIYLLLFFLIVIFRMQNIFSYIIEEVLNRNLNFTNRTYIWDTAIMYIKNNPIVGYGFEDSLIRIEKFSYLQAITCHNQLLDLIYQGGFIGLIFIFLMLKQLGNRINEIKNLKIKTVTLMALFSYLVMMLSEYYSFGSFIYIFVIFINLYQITGKELEVNHVK